MTPASHMPPAWPQLLSRDQLCAYLGGLSWDTVKKVLPVAPVDLGANVLRYRLTEIDRWIDGLPLRPARLRDSVRSDDDAATTAEVVDLNAEDRRSAALARVQRRAQGDGGWRKTG